MKRSQLILLALSVILAVSVFLPLVNIPFIGSINYFMNGKGDGKYVLILAVIAGVISFTPYVKWVCVPGVIALAIAGIFLINFNGKMGSLSSDLDGGIFGDFANTLNGAISIGYGFIVMGLSSVGLTFMPLWLTQNDKDV